MTIDTNELRRLAEHHDGVTSSVPIEPATVLELLDRLKAAEKERDTLRAKIAEMQQQEPVGTLHDDGYFVWRKPAPREASYGGWKMTLYALPGAKGEEK